MIKNKKKKVKPKSSKKKRSYDAASSFKTDDWTSATTGSANSEIANAQQPVRNKGRDAVRNNPWANRAINAIVNNAVGSGIVPNIKAKSELQKKRLKAAWKEWGETSLCDSYGRNNFYGLEALVMRSIVESGDILSIKEIQADAMKLRVLECDHLVSAANGIPLSSKSGEQVFHGIKVDEFMKPKSYFLYDIHPGEQLTNSSYREYSADKVDHVYRQDRPGQLRGISWFHPVIRSLEDFNEYQTSTLIGRKMSASIFGVVTNSNDSGLAPTALREKRQKMMELGPATMWFADNNEDVKLQTPPAVSGYEEFSRQTLRAICAGLGIPYSALTGDYSQYNFSSSKMEHGEFRKNIEQWRWQMLIPLFCEPSFKHFLSWCAIAKGIPVDGVTCEWIPPAWSMIDAEKEYNAALIGVRSGFTTREKVLLELGHDPEEIDQEISDSNKKSDKLGIILDTDPRKVTKAGLLQMQPNTQVLPEEPSEKPEETLISKE